MSEISEEVRYVMLYYYRKGKTAAKTCRKLCAVYGENVVSERGTQNWFARFRSGNFDIKDAPRSGRPVTNKAEEILQLVKQDRHASCQKIAETLNINHMTVWNHLKRAGYAKTLDFWVAPSNHIDDKDATTETQKVLESFAESSKELNSKSKLCSRRGERSDDLEIVIPEKKRKQTKPNIHKSERDHENVENPFELKEITQPTVNLVKRATNIRRANQRNYTGTAITTPPSQQKVIKGQNCQS